MDVLKAVLPQRYSPLQANGNGIQSIYLTEILPNFADVLSGLIGNEVRPLLAGGVVDAAVEDDKIVTGDDLDVWERRLEEQVESDVSVTETDREAIVRARVGQGLFKQRVMQIETSCRITGVDNLSHLVASHCKLWRDSTNEERLNGENGLLLTPSIDLSQRLLPNPESLVHVLEGVGLVTLVMRGLMGHYEDFSDTMNGGERRR
jgi:putative restriction endonuclease